jgi:hypothetical protein
LSFETTLALAATLNAPFLKPAITLEDEHTDAGQVLQEQINKPPKPIAA